MEINEGQTLTFDHVASYRSKLRLVDTKEPFNRFIQHLKTNGLEKVGPLITTTHEIVGNQPEDIMVDVEFLIPVSQAFESENEYVYKGDFRLVHALKLSHIGNPALLNQSYELLESYIIQNKLQKITPFYNVSLNDASVKHGEIPVTDIYAGINPSSL
ncbi:hypothetical protein [Paenibacillus sp.]|uniref:hypothetical protein n=1 Tax=Paenibacillus sp. TaxID=58172 RepID=UPI0028390999|nr:hypothetical protein [Paenibacillus sp.]MDR0268054.1 hypothetical protein [Paenibacillus sp.]